MRLLALIAVLGCDAGTRGGSTDRATGSAVVAVVAVSHDAAVSYDAASIIESDELEVEHLGPIDPRYGELGKHVFRKKIKQHLTEIARCYETLQTANAHDRKLVIRFKIDGSGRVLEASAAGVDPDVDRCVATVIRQITFPPPPRGGALRITYPFWLDGTGS